MAIQPGDVAAFQMHGGTFTLWAIVDSSKRILQVFDTEQTADWYLNHIKKNGGELRKKPIGVWTSERLERLEGFWINGKHYEVKR